MNEECSVTLKDIRSRRRSATACHAGLVKGLYIHGIEVDWVGTCPLGHDLVRVFIPWYPSQLQPRFSIKTGKEER
jgi:hypothetical protein